MSTFRHGLLALLIGASVQAGIQPITTELVVDGLNEPVWITSIPGDFSRIFVLEQPGVIRIVRDGQLLPTPLLDINSLVMDATGDEDERGLLGMAFDPNFPQNGYFYLDFVDVNNNTRIVRYAMNIDADAADPDSAYPILTIEQPEFSNHKAGWISFGKDDFLYIATGDGGSAFDPGNRAQDITDQLLGKILRIHVGSDDFLADAERNYAIPADNPFFVSEGDDEIWAYGLRNPYRNGFDSLTGDLFITDVGQNMQEEINFQPANTMGGQNYGWRCMEGNLCTGLSGCTCNDVSLTQPIYTYNLSDMPPGTCAIIGGEVYRGCAMPSLNGMYFFADHCSNQIWTLEQTPTGIQVMDRTAALNPVGSLDIEEVSSFGHDAFGELYITDRDEGEIFKIVPANVAPDCNENFTIDMCDIFAGTSNDMDNNGIPDECSNILQIVSSIPPTGAIDARQPSDLDGTNPTGINFVDIMFSGFVDSLAASDFIVSQQGGTLPAPTVLDVMTLNDLMIRLTLSSPIDVIAWTDITHVPSNTTIRIGYLPADVNGDATSSPVDILALIDSLNGVTQLPIYSTDIDRSGQANPADILREIDLLNGADEFDSYFLAMLPPDNGNGNGNDNGNTNSNSNDNGNTNSNGNGNVNGNANDNGNTNGDSNENSNDNGNTNDNNNGNLNGNSNNNDNDNGNLNGNGNGNSNGNSNANANGNGNDNGNTNANDNGNSNGNVNGNDNGGGSVCPNGEIRLSASLSGNSGQSGNAAYRDETDGRRRFDLNVSGFSSGTHNIVVNNVVVGQVNVGGSGSGGVDWDTNDGNFPGNFPNIMVGATITVGGQATGSFVLNCS